MQPLNLALIKWAQNTARRIAAEIAQIPIGTLSDPKQAQVYQARVNTIKFLEARAYDMLKTINQGV